MPTKGLLRNRILNRAMPYRALESDSFTDILDKGFQVRAVPSERFSAIGGISPRKAIRSAWILLLGMVCPNRHFRLIAVALASDESGEAVRLFLQAVYQAIKVLFPKEQAGSLWYMSDLGSGIEKGLAELSKWLHQLGEIQKEADLLKGDCFAHFMQNQFPKLRRSASSLAFSTKPSRVSSNSPSFPTALLGGFGKAPRRSALPANIVQASRRNAL